MLKIPKIAVFIESSRISGRRLLKGIFRYARLYGPWSFYANAPEYIKATSTIDNKKLIEQGLDGVITRDNEDIKDFLNANIPVIVNTVINESSQSPYKLAVDKFETGKAQAQYLIEKDFRNFAFIGFDNLYWSQASKKTFTQTVKDAGFNIKIYKPPEKIKEISWEQELRFIAQWLQTLPKPTALAACNDIRAQQVLEAVKMTSIKVPEEIAVLGADNDDMICELTSPPLSSVNIDFEQAGYDAAELLDKLIHKQPIKETTILAHTTTITTRESTNVIPIEDPDVVNAIHFIRKFSSKHLKVSDVVQAVAVSRRTLERKFNKILGKTLKSEIRRTHTEKIASMLQETDLSLSQIAYKLGHLDPKHISRYFKQERNMTPSQYRQIAKKQKK